MKPRIFLGEVWAKIVVLIVLQAVVLDAVASQEGNDRIAELESKLEQSIQLIQLLSDRVAKLETEKQLSSSETVVSQIPATDNERFEELERSIIQVSENSAKVRDLGVPLRGFADMGYSENSEDIGDRKGGFLLGNLDLYLTPNLGDRMKFLAEVVIEFEEDGELLLDLERLQAGYTFSDAMTGWIGRYHTPYGYWNTGYHHGAQIQTAISRPRFVEFEDKGGILPAHAVGVLGSGSVRAGTGKIQYDLMVANGNRISDGVLDFNSVKDDNNNKLLGVNAKYVFGEDLYGLALGIHLFNQDVSSENLADFSENETEMNVFGGYLTYEMNNWEVIGEYYKFRNDDLSGDTGKHSSWAAFSQIAYTFNDDWTPYVRYEKTDLDQEDNYFADMITGRSYDRQVVGLRYDLNAFSAIKAELNRTELEELTGDVDYNEIHVQVSVRF
jgi:hypothetical protein